MENLDFNGTSSLVQMIDTPPPSSLVIEEKKLEEPQMMEFSSSVADLMPTPQAASSMMGPPQDVYTNPTNGRVSGISLGGETTQQQRKTQNPFNLTDEQFNALLAGVVAVVIYSATVQNKLSGIVPNFGGINGTIASVLAAAVVYYFAHRFIKNR
jgi:hypothetical protein